MTRLRLCLCSLALISGCLYHARERIDENVCSMGDHPFDLQPPEPSATGSSPAAPVPSKKVENLPGPDLDVQTTAFIQSEQPAPEKPKMAPKIPPEVPGSETPILKVTPISATSTDADKEQRKREIQNIYPPLPPLQQEPRTLPGPNGQPYTLSALQRLAALNSPQLREAEANVQAARGNLIQARAYPNPTIGYQVQPSNDGSTAGAQGPFIDQTIKFYGKLKLASAMAEMDLRTAELALKRARSDLATQVRTNFYAVLVARETVRVNKALARYTDGVYLLQALQLEYSQNFATHEPAALRAQARSVRLAYKQAIQTYEYAWVQLVAAVGLRQLPLTEVAGRIDAFIPNFDFDTIKAHMLQNHTDVLIARNGLDKANYNLKLAKITPFPDVDVNVALLKETALPPKQWVNTVTIGMPFPLWNQNKGAIYAAEAGLVSATEESHRVELALTSTLASAYMGYKTNLDALEYYRRYILPDQVIYYRGVLDRRQIDINNSPFGDLVTAQQAVATSVSNYLGILGTLWTSVVSVADVLQTDDLFQLGKPQELPKLPDLDKLLPWPCCHDCPPGADGKGSCGSCAPGVIPAAVQSAQPGSGQTPMILKQSDSPAETDHKPAASQSGATASQPAQTGDKEYRAPSTEYRVLKMLIGN